MSIKIDRNFLKEHELHIKSFRKRLDKAVKNDDNYEIVETLKLIFCADETCIESFHAQNTKCPRVSCKNCRRDFSKVLLDLYSKTNNKKW